MATTKAERIKLGFKDMIRDVDRPTDPKNHLADLDERSRDSQRKGA